MDKTRQVLKDYYKIKEQIEVLESKAREKKEEITALLQDAPEHKLQISEAAFSLRTYTTYVYSPATQEMEKKLKLTKKIEETKGIAQIKSETYTPVMRRLQDRKGGGA